MLTERGQRHCVVRLSRALSTPDGWWDIGGFALRIDRAGAGGGPADLLFASTGVGRAGRHVLRATRHPMDEPMTTLLPVCAGASSLLLLVRRLAGRAEDGFELCVAVDGADWSPVGMIEVVLGGAIVRVPPEVDGRLLAKVLRAVKSVT